MKLNLTPEDMEGIRVRSLAPRVLAYFGEHLMNADGLVAGLTISTGHVYQIDKADGQPFDDGYNNETRLAALIAR